MPRKPDLSEFLKLSKPKRPPCKVGTALAVLTDDEQAKLQAALATDQGIITNAAVAEWLKARGHQVHAATVTSHRKGACSCNADRA